jgi:uncharacterized protein
MRNSCPPVPNRRDLLKTTGVAAAALAVGALPWKLTRAADDSKTRKLLFFTKSSGFQHSVITRTKPGELAYAERIMLDLGKQHGYDVTVTKDGGYFTPEKLAPFDAVVFYTSGDLATLGTDKQPPMPKDGKDTLIKFVESGKGFLGLHCAADTFHGPNDGPTDPYIKMLGGEFEHHGAQQDAKILVADKNFGPIADLQEFQFPEEWYIVKNLAPDMHVILYQDTASMSGQDYKTLKPYPETWARIQGKGRVFYSTMGHREDVWKKPIFEQVLLGGLAWVTGRADADTKPNFKEVTPGAEDRLRKD